MYFKAFLSEGVRRYLKSAECAAPEMRGFVPTDFRRAAVVIVGWYAAASDTAVPPY
jgi:hypothetical protein